MNRKQNAMCTELLSWLEKLPESIPLIASHDSGECAELAKLISKSGLNESSTDVAWLWLRVGSIDRAHGIVQEDKSDRGSYLHAMVHRIEGDFWNAKYWIRQVRNKSFLNQIGAHVYNRVEESGKIALADAWGLIQHKSFQATHFIDACELVLNDRSSEESDRPFLEWVAFCEWQSVSD